MKRDQVIFDLIEKEHQRQLKGIELIASENFVSDEVMEQWVLISRTNMPRAILQTLLRRLPGSGRSGDIGYRTREGTLRC